MNGSGHVRRPSMLDEMTALFRQAKLGTEHGLSGSRSQANNYFWLDQRDFRFEPGAAGIHLGDAGLLVYPPLAAFVKLEMFHRVGEVDARTINSGIGKCAVQYLAGRPHKGTSLAIFDASRLLADKHDLRRLRALAHYGLGRVAIKLTPTAFLHAFPERLGLDPIREK